VIVAADLQFWLLIWLVTASYVLVRHWRSELGTGLVFTYVLSYGAIHWLAAAIYLFPWYVAPSVDITLAGLRVSTIGLIGFAVGGEIGAAVFGPPPMQVATDGRGMTADGRIVTLYLVVGAVFYGVIFPIVAALPTVSALASTASSLMILGVALKAWNGWQRGRLGVCWFWLAASAAFPFVTLAGQGVLGFGFAAMVIVAAFVASFYRPRWQVVAVGVLVAYAGLSVYVTYMRDRRDIRAVVWGGETMGTRLDRLVETFADTEWFDVNDIEHLRRIDGRLNQNALLGAAVDGIDSGAVPLAYGATLRDAALALIPRALWPSKPVVAGSGDLVATYTGLFFAEGTSVGIGHVMEWYVNFGVVGVALGFVIIGAVTVYVDRAAAMWLHRGDISRFALWFMPGMSLLQVGGSFVEMTSSAAASVVVVLLLDRVTRRFVQRPRAFDPGGLDDGRTVRP
jgi:hypothetical protein